jgi:hypothetical protein
MSEDGIPHHVSSHEQKRVGIFIAILAVIMAVVGTLSNNEANTMIVKEVKASNGYAWYQSKRQRSYMNELEIKRADFELAGSPSDAQRRVLGETKARLKSKNDEYEKENEVIRLKAEADERLAELASHRHHWFEYAETVLHIAVVLCSLTLLTEMNLFYRLGVAVTLAGVALALLAATISEHHAGHKPDSPTPAGVPAQPAGH